MPGHTARPSVTLRQAHRPWTPSGRAQPLWDPHGSPPRHRMTAPSSQGGNVLARAWHTADAHGLRGLTPFQHQDGRGGPGARGWALELGALRSPEARHSLSRAPVRLGGSGPEATCRSDLRGGAGPSWLGALGSGRGGGCRQPPARDYSAPPLLNLLPAPSSNWPEGRPWAPLCA